MKTLRIAALGVAVLIPLIGACSANSGSADDGANYPNDCGTLDIIVDKSAGGSTDLSVRALADELANELDVRTQVTNSPGGDGSTAFNQLKNAPADGCTLTDTIIPDHLAYILPDSPVDYSKEDFSFAASFVAGPQALVVAADSPYQTLDDLIADGEKKGQLLGVADAPNGGDAMINAQFAGASGVHVQQVVVDGSVEKVTGVMGGQVQFSNGSISGVLSNIKSGQLRALAVWSEERSPFLPDVPTAKEQGVDVVMETKHALTGPAGMPESVRAKLESTVKTISDKPEFQDKLTKIGQQPAYLSGEDFSKAWDEEVSTIENIDFTTLN